MKRNSTTLFLASPNAITLVPWVNNALDFSAFTEPTLSILQTAWQNFVDSGEELEVIPDPEPVAEPHEPVAEPHEPVAEPPVPDWDGFNAALITDPTYHLAVANIRASALPGLDTPVVVALGQVADKGVSSFSLAFPPFCEYGQVSIEQRELWAQLAEFFNMPADFVAVIRG